MFGKEIITAYVQLLNEGTVSYRPTFAILLNENTARLLKSENFDPDEEWEFPVGSVVLIAAKNLNEGEVLVAMALAPQIPMK